MQNNILVRQTRMKQNILILIILLPYMHINIWTNKQTALHTYCGGGEKGENTTTQLKKQLKVYLIYLQNLN